MMWRFNNFECFDHVTHEQERSRDFPVRPNFPAVKEECDTVTEQSPITNKGKFSLYLNNSFWLGFS